MYSSKKCREVLLMRFLFFLNTLRKFPSVPFLRLSDVSEFKEVRCLYAAALCHKLASYRKAETEIDDKTCSSSLSFSETNVIQLVFLSKFYS